MRFGKLLLELIAFASSILLLVPEGIAQSFTFVSVDVPCSNCPGGIARQTRPQGINPAGDIVGDYNDAVGKQHGFLLRAGRFSTIDVPGTLAGLSGGTLPTGAKGINPGGDIVGTYTAPVSTAPPSSPAYCPAAGSVACVKGFFYSHGRFSTVLAPNHPGAIPQRITPDRDIYGCLHDFDLGPSMFGFARTQSGYISLLPGGGELANPTKSVPMSMNNGATPDGTMIVGLYTDVSQVHHGYVVQNGAFQTYDPPGSTFTQIWDVNPSGNFVGFFRDSGGGHGFLQLADGSPAITINVPATARFNAVSTSAIGINPGGAIVGQYTDTSGHTHGFLAVPLN